MAGPTTNDFGAGGSFYLDPNQQDLLLAALTSNTQAAPDVFANDLSTFANGLPPQSFDFPADGSYFDTDAKIAPATSLQGSGLGIDESPYLDNLDGDTSFDFDNGDTSDLMIGALPGDSPDTSEKRKNPDDDDEDDIEGGGKRREGDDKQAKKPGRKPLTTEPTTKRKAQNRAAQRAFRERKEKHLKDLETKVDELEKSSDAANHENGLLRAQVQRLQVELRDYRKRLSLNSSSVNRSSPMMGGYNSFLGNNGAAANNTFQFDFPRFGGLPGSHILDSGPLAKSTTSSTSLSGSASPAAPLRQDSTRSSFSPKSQAMPSMVSSPEQIGGSPSVSSASRAGSINGSVASKNNSISTEVSTAPGRIFQFNSGSSTHSSPSDSSLSAAGQDSSCGTSPEPTNPSPKNTNTLTDALAYTGNQEVSNQTPAPILSGLDFFTNQNGGQFDPALFGEYRDTQNAVVGEGDFTNGFFNEAFPITDFGSPFHFGDTPVVQKPNPLEEIERVQSVDTEVAPSGGPTQMLNCHKIWDKLANRADFKDGTIDIDSLCSELRSKARCSDAGVTVDDKDVEAALEKLPRRQK